MTPTPDQDGDRPDFDVEWWTFLEGEQYPCEMQIDGSVTADTLRKMADWMDHQEAERLKRQGQR